MTLVGPAALCRLDAELVNRIREQRDLAPIVRGCLVATVAGLSMYGITMGLWRGPLQSLYSAIKLVVVFVGIFGFTTLTNTVLAGLMRAQLELKQVALCVLLGIASSSIVLGSLAPLSWLVVAHAPAFDPSLLDADAVRTARLLLLAHVVVVGFAGLVGVRRVYALLNQLVDDPAIARRVLVGWLAVEGLVGAELSWLLRPFVGKPRLAVSFLRADAFEYSIFDELYQLTRTAAGPAGPWLGMLVVVIVCIAVVVQLRGEIGARVHVVTTGVLVCRTGSTKWFHVAWAEIVQTRRIGAEVEVTRELAQMLGRQTLRLRCASLAEAVETYRAIELGRSASCGPFRSPAPRSVL